MIINNLKNIISNSKHSDKMPVLFVGHGNPMNAIRENEFTENFRAKSLEIPTPKAILCISAHWETNGTYITAMKNPRTIHDFGGFPDELYEVQYPAKGSPELAKETQTMVNSTSIELDYNWGLDHGAWSVIKHFYPKADIPVIEMSLNYKHTAVQHYDLAKELKKLRNKGVLILGSGNIVHNLLRVSWNKIDEEFAFDWALEAKEKMKSFIANGNHQGLINFSKQGTAFNLAIPTPEHYLPLIYTLALQDTNEEVKFFNDKLIAGSLAMTSLEIS